MEIMCVEENWENSVTTAMLKSWVQKEQIIQNIYLYSPLKLLVALVFIDIMNFR